VNGTQQAIGAAAVGLLFVNEWTSPDRGVLGGVLWNGSNPTEAHSALTRLAGELIFVGGAIILSGIGGAWTTGVAAIVAALWVLWAINRYGHGTKTTPVGATATSNTQEA
jgi:hypothetical protein